MVAFIISSSFGCITHLVFMVLTYHISTATNQDANRDKDAMRKKQSSISLDFLSRPLAHASRRDFLKLAAIAINTNSVTEMDYLTQMENPSPRDAATRWMAENPDIVQSWSA